MTLAFPAPDPARRATLALPPQAAMASRAVTSGPATVGQAPPCHDARRLTGPQGTATILLDGQSYVLRITRAGKLILTK
jgi:hemin uptake protein HemP